MTAINDETTGPIVLLGPQTDFNEIGEMLDEVQADGSVALITTGWQENESEDEALIEKLRRPAINLALHARSERIYAQESGYAKARAARQARLQHLQRFYRMRLEAIDEAARAIGVRHVDAELLDEQHSITVAQMCHLDNDHLQRCQTEWAAFDSQWPAAEQASIASERAELAEIVDRCAAVVISGGHLTALLNRLRLFNVLANLGNKPIIAWSAGAMCLSDRIVLFHDSPPFGKNLAQMLDVGLGLIKNVVVMPDPSRRLRTHESEGISRFTQRMAPAECLGMDIGARLIFNQGRLQSAFAHRLLPNGQLQRGWRL